MISCGYNILLWRYAMLLASWYVPSFRVTRTTTESPMLHLPSLDWSTFIIWLAISWVIKVIDKNAQNQHPFSECWNSIRWIQRPGLQDWYISPPGCSGLWYPQGPVATKCTLVLTADQVSPAGSRSRRQWTEIAWVQQTDWSTRWVSCVDRPGTWSWISLSGACTNVTSNTSAPKIAQHCPSNSSRN